MLSNNTLDFLGALATLAVIAWRFVQPLAEALGRWFINRTPENTHAMLAKVAQKAVAGVEQLSKAATAAGGIAPGDRKAAALEAAKVIAARLHIRLPKDADKLATLLGTYIEDAVSKLPPSGFTGASSATMAAGTYPGGGFAIVADTGPEHITIPAGATVNTPDTLLSDAQGGQYQITVNQADTANSTTASQDTTPAPGEFTAL